MKKSFYFALALTAGLFASCSSDDLTVSNAPDNDVEINDNTVAQIKFMLGSPNGSTRGTGSVLGTKWGGQKFNIFMFKKNTFEPATYKKTENANKADSIFYNDTLVTTPGTMIAEQKINDVVQYQYFPSTGAFSFWAYRADDAGQKDNEGKAIIKATKEDGTEATTAEDSIQIRIPVVIDGTQDLMLAVTDTTKAKEELIAADAKITEDAAASPRIFSAYAARRGVNPTMDFTHMLTRLTFKIKAADRSVSTQATKKTTDANEITGFRVTKVEVWSKNEGEMIVAHKGNQAPAAIADRLVWTKATQVWNDTTTLEPFQLKSRATEIEPAKIFLQPINSMAAAGQDVNVSTADYVFGDNGASKFTIGNDLVCYESDAINATTGMPEDAPTTVGAVKANGKTVYVLTYKDGTHADGVTKWNTYTENSDPSAALKDLEPIVPVWTGYTAATAGWEEIQDEVTEYTWTDVTSTATENEKQGATDVNAAPTKTTVGNLDAIVKYKDGQLFEHYYKLTAIKHNIDNATAYTGANDPETDNFAGTDGQIVSTGTGTNIKYYKYHIAGATLTAGDAQATDIGESMLVAPADENGYFIRFTYVRSKKITGDHVENITGEGVINVKANNGKFEAGKTYGVTAILYSDGEISSENKDGKINDYDDGELDDNGQGYGIE